MTYRLFVVTMWATIGVAFYACAGEPDSTLVTRADSAGVALITSGGEDRLLDWGREEVFRIGGGEEGPESFYVVTHGSVGHDDAGRIYVLDFRAKHVVVFNHDGSYRRTMGGPGEGPGELTSPNSIAVAPDGSVSVFDFGKGGLVRYDAEGATLAVASFPFYPWPGAGRHISVTLGGMVVATMLPPEVPDTFRYALQFVSDRDTVILAQRSFPRPPMARYCGGGLNLPVIFEAQLTWTAEETSIALARSADYEVDVLRDRALVQRIRRELPARNATSDLAAQEIGEGYRVNFGSGPCTIPPREMVEKRGFAEFIPWVNALAVSPTGEVWVQRKVVGSSTDGPVDVFDRTGVYVGTWPEGSPFPLFFLGPNRFSAVFTDEFDVARLVVYDINRSPS